MSTALGRLRRHFADDLLARSGNRYELTPLAVQLRPLVASALSGAERVFASLSEFDPSSAVRTFEIMSSDYGVATVGPVLARTVSEQAPGVRLRMTSFEMTALDRPDDAMREVDLMLVPHGVVGGFPHRDLFSDEWVAVVDHDRTPPGTVLDMDDLAQRAWGLTEGGPAGTTFSLSAIPVVRQMELLGIVPRIVASTNSFPAVPLLVAGTDRLAVVQ